MYRGTTLSQPPPIAINNINDLDAATPRNCKRSVKEKLIKIGAKVVSHGRYIAFQMAEIAIPRNLFADILRLIAELRPPPVMSTALWVPLSRVRSRTTGDLRLDDSNFGIPRRATASRPAPERIYKPRRGHNDISVLPKSCYRRSLNCDKAVISRMSVQISRRISAGGGPRGKI